MLGDCKVISFDPKQIKRKIEKSYGMRTKAHDLMLQADILLDEVLTALYGEKTN
jgi:hypothetical protein